MTAEGLSFSSGVNDRADMYRNSTVIDSSGKWASAEEILASARNQTLSRPTSSTYDWGIEDTGHSVPGNHVENASVGRTGDHRRFSYQTTASSVSAHSYLPCHEGMSPRPPSSHIPHPPPEGYIPLVPVRRDSQIEHTPQNLQSSPTHVELSVSNASQVPHPSRIPSTRTPQHPHGGVSQPTTTDLYPYQQLNHPQDPAIHSAWPIQPDAFVAINPFRPQNHCKDEKGPLSFDDIPIPLPSPESAPWMWNRILPSMDQKRMQSQAMDEQKLSNGSFLQAGMVVHPSGPQALPGNQVPNSQPPEIDRRPSTVGYTATQPKEYVKEAISPRGQVQAPGLPSRRLSPVRRTSDTGDKSYDQYLTNHPAYPSKPSFTPSQSHSAHERTNPTGYDPYSRPTNVSAEPVKSSFWPNISTFCLWPFNHSKGSLKHANYSSPYDATPFSDGDDSNEGMIQIIVNFVAGTLPSQVYSHFLLRLPSLYFSRVAHIFEEAELTLPEIKKMVLEIASLDKGLVNFHALDPSSMPPQYTRLKLNWEAFIDSVMLEWKMFSIISVLLLSAILIFLQIDSAAADPVTRYTALSSLICALISLLFGCIYIVRFGSMRKTYKAAEWALEAKKTKTLIWWNVWVLLAMPVIWLAWSIILYIACIMSFVWRSSSQDDTTPARMTETGLLVVRIVISSVLAMGAVYGGLIISTFNRYGDVMDKAWKRRIDGWVVEKYAHQGGYRQYPDYRHHDPNPYHWRQPTTPYADASSFIRPPIPLAAHDDRRNDVRDHGHSSGLKNEFTEVDAKTSSTTANYIPPPVLQESSFLSSGNSALSTSPNVFVTASHTRFDRSGLQQGNLADFTSTVPEGSQYTTLNTSTPPKPSVSSQDPDPGSIRRKTSLAVPPPASLPPIPGTPMSSSSGPRSTTTASSSANQRYSSGFNLDSREVHSTGADTRARLRSPLVSVSGSEYLGSDRDAEESVQLSNSEATDFSISVPRTPAPSPISPR